MPERIVSVRRVIPATAAEIFSVLADPAQHRLIDGSGLVRGNAGSSSSRLCLGAEFEMHMRAGAPYRIVNRVVEFDEPHVIAWEVHPEADWA